MSARRDEQAVYTTYIRHRVEGIQMDPRAAEKGRDINDRQRFCSRIRTSPTGGEIFPTRRFAAAA